MGAGSHRALQECWPGFGPSLCQEGPLTVTCQEFSYLHKDKVKLGDHKQWLVWSLDLALVLECSSSLVPGNIIYKSSLEDKQE